MARLGVEEYGTDDRRKNQRVILYALCEPDTLEVRYFGVTSRRPLVRFWQHLSASRRARTHKDYWIRKLIRAGQRPALIEIAILGCFQDALDLEVWFIKLHRAMGTRLVNITDGGEGILNPPLEVRKRMGNRHPRTLEQKQRMSEARQAWCALQPKKIKPPKLSWTEIVAKRTASLKISGAKPEFLEKMRQIGLKNVASLPFEIRRVKFRGRSISQEKQDRAKLLRQENPGMSLRAIAREVGTDHCTVGRLLNESLPRKSQRDEDRASAVLQALARARCTGP